MFELVERFQFGPQSRKSEFEVPQALGGFLKLPGPAHIFQCQSGFHGRSGTSE